jgi:NAD(P)-dependent dehydrogenase (short-subunit alcohol dehydrogenase family)
MDVRQHEERVAIVTESGRGIERSIVLGLVRASVHVIATAGRERSEIEAVGREAEAHNAQASVLPLVADVTTASDCEKERFGRLDILVNNAGRGMLAIRLRPGQVGSGRFRLRPGGQHLRGPRDHAPPRIFALWSVKGCA